NREIAIAQRSLDQRLVGQQRLQLAPKRDTFEARSGDIEARRPERQRRIHVERRVDKGRGYEMTGRIAHFAGLRRDAGLDRHDTPCRDADIDATAAITECGVFDYKI